MNTQTSWEVVNPSGILNVEPTSTSPHYKTIEGKIVLLHWNNKHNGDVFLNRLAELLTKHVRGVRIIKSWEVVPDIIATSPHPDSSKQFARTLAELRPDIVIASQAD